MMKDVLKRVLRYSLLCGIMVLGILAFRTEAVQAATTKYVAANTVSYTTVGSAKIKIKYISSDKYRIYFKKNGETYKKTVTATNIYSSSPYTVKFMKCNISTGNTKTICSTSVAVMSVYKVTSKYAIIWKDGSSCYKYTYSTGKLTEYTI